MYPKTIIVIALAALTFLSCEKKKGTAAHEHSGSSSVPAQTDTLKKSIPKQEHAQIGKAHIMITYHAPAVRGRTIWGGLVPYGEVWVTGAHTATALEVNQALIINGKEIPAGKYALFTIPNEREWTIILNKNWEQHLADEYDPKDDVMRIQVKSELTERLQERLRYTIVSSDNSHAIINIRWEKLMISIPFAIK